jgi:hypothetical protein
MNGLTPQLAAAQSSLSPRYTLAVRAGPRSTAWGRAGAAWEVVAALPSGLAAWHGHSIAMDSVALPGGVLRAFLSWHEGEMTCQFVATTALADAGAWQGNALISVASFTATAAIDTPRPALVAEGGRIHLYYLLPDGNIYVRLSSDGGATWGSAATVYGGGNAEGEISACHFGEANVHLVHFSTRTDVLRLRGASRLGSGAWQVWDVHGDATGWVAAGVMVTGARSATLLAWARTPGPYTHHLGALHCAVSAAGAMATRDATVETIWLVSGDTAIRPARHAVGRGLGGWLHTCQEQAAGDGYLCVGAIDAATGRIEEPAPITAVPLGSTPLERHVAPLEIGAQTLLVGLGAIYCSAHGPEAASDIEVDENAVIAYRLETRAGAGGWLEMMAAPSSALADVHAGWALWLTRRCTKGSETGAVTQGFRVLRVERGAAETRILAADALGLLADTRARRPLQFVPGICSMAGAVERLSAWVGLDAFCVDLLGAAPLRQWSGGEEGLHALHALLRTQPVGIWSRCGVGARPQIVVAARSASPLATFGESSHPIAAQVRIEDARSPRLVVVHGVAVRGAPEEGEAWALAAAQNAEPTVRARPLYRLNRNLDAAAQAAEAAALLAASRHAEPAGWVHMQAHLALETEDCICVSGEKVYVQRIVEQWERRRLVQQVAYGR